MANLESGVDDILLEACKTKKLKTIRVDPKQYNGFPDRVVFNTVVGEIHYIEEKNETYYERTHNQKVWAKIIKACNGKYFLIDGETEMREYIRRYIDGTISIRSKEN